MAETKDFQCPNCGSPLDLHGEQTEVKCPYCGSRVIVPDELRPRRSPAPVYSAPVYNFPKYDEQISEQVATAGKVAAGIAITTMIAPIIVTGVILCIVGVFVAFVLFTVNSTISSVSNLDPQALQTAIIATMELPTPANTAGASEVPTDVPTLPPTPVPFSTPFSKVLFHDDFTTKKGWSVFKDSDYTLAYVKGGYRIFIDAKGGQASWLENVSYKDINVTAEISYTEGPSDGRFGVTCRVKKGSGFYSFEFSPSGWHAIEKYISGESGSVSNPLAEGQMDTSGFSKDAIFHLRGDCVGDTLTLYLNDVALLQVVDSSFASGGIGVIASAGVSGDGGVDVLFRDYTVTGDQ